MIHRKKNDLLHKIPHICVITAAGRVNSVVVKLEAYTGSRFPGDSPHYCFVGGVKFSLCMCVCVCVVFVCFVLFGGGGGG